VLKEYPDTNLEILGYTDSSGSNDHNLKLSQARAKAVADYLASAQVDHKRLASQGYGEAQAAASNASKEGREKNRRVKIHIQANEELKKADQENAQSKA
jgi:outer membrane protein OmpA-like peptidoglycan-associated protein